MDNHHQNADLQDVQDALETPRTLHASDTQVGSYVRSPAGTAGSPETSVERSYREHQVKSIGEQDLFINVNDGSAQAPLNLYY